MENGSGYKAEGMNHIPDLTTGEYVYTHAVHGYACACMDVDTDGEGGITRIRSVRQLPLSRCRTDPASAGFSIRIPEGARRSTLLKSRRAVSYTARRSRNFGVFSPV